jgi:hypothetical protein
MPQPVKFVANNLKVDGDTWTLVDTDVVQFDGPVVHLNTGHWWTVSTRMAMNQALAPHNLRVVERRNPGGGIWHVLRRGHVCAEFDYVTGSCSVFLR